MNARDYRKTAQAHMAKAAHLLAGQPGLSRTARIARLQHATSHLATAMASVAGAVALEMASESVDTEAAIADMMTGIEALLEDGEKDGEPS